MGLQGSIDKVKLVGVHGLAGVHVMLAQDCGPAWQQWWVKQSRVHNS